MKQILKIFIAVTLLVSFSSVSSFADVVKGQKHYLKFMKKKTKLTGSEFARQHTKAQWEKLFENDAQGFISTFTKKFPRLTPFLTKESFKAKYMQDLKDFCIEFAKDSGNIPSC